MATAISLNFSLVNDLLRNPEDSGKAMSILSSAAIRSGSSRRS